MNDLTLSYHCRHCGLRGTAQIPGYRRVDASLDGGNPLIGLSLERASAFHRQQQEGILAFVPCPECGHQQPRLFIEPMVPWASFLVIGLLLGLLQPSQWWLGVLLVGAGVWVTTRYYLRCRRLAALVSVQSR